MVFTIIKKLKDCDDEYFEPSNSAINNAFRQIKKIVNDLIRQRNNSMESMEKSRKLIKEMYPDECLKIEKNLEDDTGVLACCFFAPNVLLELINEFNENKLNMQLFDIDLNQTVNNDSKMYSELLDGFTGILESGINSEEAKSAVKKTIQLNLIASGELEKFIQNEQE
jgi:predicted metal-dependent RNase